MKVQLNQSHFQSYEAKMLWHEKLVYTDLGSDIEPFLVGPTGFSIDSFRPEKYKLDTVTILWRASNSCSPLERSVSVSSVGDPGPSPIPKSRSMRRSVCSRKLYWGKRFASLTSFWWRACNRKSFNILLVIFDMGPVDMAEVPWQPSQGGD